MVNQKLLVLITIQNFVLFEVNFLFQYNLVSINHAMSTQLNNKKKITVKILATGKIMKTRKGKLDYKY